MQFFVQLRKGVSYSGQRDREDGVEGGCLLGRWPALCSASLSWERYKVKTLTFAKNETESWGSLSQRLAQDPSLSSGATQPY